MRISYSNLHNNQYNTIQYNIKLVTVTSVPCGTVTFYAKWKSNKNFSSVWNRDTVLRALRSLFATFGCHRQRKLSHAVIWVLAGLSNGDYEDTDLGHFRLGSFRLTSF